MGTGRKAAAGMLGQVVLGFGVLFWGWGFDDLGGFFRHPARASFVAVGVLGGVVVLLMGLDIQVFRRGRKPVGRQRWLLGMATLTSIFLSFFVAYGDRRDLLTFAGADALRYVGLALYTIGNAIVLVALKTLDKQYSGYVTVQEDHQLVQTGIYSVIRHPFYLRALLVVIGGPLVFRSWLVLPAFVLVSIFVAVRIRQEEKLLAEHFGAEFEAYRRRTWRLLPRIY